MLNTLTSGARTPIKEAYKYNTWGKVLSTTGSMASSLGSIQPFRYRGYVYDVETGLYYLRSRYYNPYLNRFLCEDDFRTLNWNNSSLSTNLYTYCDNEPVFRADEDGNLWFLTALVSAVVNVAITFVAAKVTGQEYTLLDAGIAAAAGVLNTTGLYGPVLNATLTGSYTAYNAYQNGASIEGALLSGVVSGCAAGVSIANLSGFMGTPLDLATSTAADLVFGAGYNTVAASVYASVTTDVNSTKENTASEDFSFVAKPSKQTWATPVKQIQNIITLER